MLVVASEAHPNCPGANPPRAVFNPGLALTVLWGWSQVIEPLRSRCVCLRVPAPTVAQVSGVLEKIYKKEGGKAGLPKDVQERIAATSGRNLRKAILMMEAMHVKHGHTIAEGTAPQVADWEAMVGIIGDNILQEQSPRMLMTVRGQLYDLLACCIPAEMIIQACAGSPLVFNIWCPTPNSSALRCGLTCTTAIPVCCSVSLWSCSRKWMTRSSLRYCSRCAARTEKPIPFLNGLAQ